MTLIPINSLTHEDVQIYQQLRDNVISKDNSFIADSSKVVNMLLESNIEVKSIFATQEYYDEFEELINSKKIAKLYLGTKEIMQNIVGHTLHHNVMMHGVRPQEYPLKQLSNHIIMLDEISSTQNIGAIARSAAALGVDSYLIPKQGPHPYARRALRVSMGYISKLHYHQYSNIIETIQALKQNGYTIYGAEVSSSSLALSKIKVASKWVLIMGHESKGLSKEILDLCDVAVEIEMQAGVKSFNVATAASIIMYKFLN